MYLVCTFYVMYVYYKWHLLDLTKNFFLISPFPPVPRTQVSTRENKFCESYSLLLSEVRIGEILCTS
jgi:hypothetical protein